jgi:hypothetical protein
MPTSGPAGPEPALHARSRSLARQGGRTADGDAPTTTIPRAGMCAAPPKTGTPSCGAEAGGAAAGMASGLATTGAAGTLRPRLLRAGWHEDPRGGAVKRYTWVMGAPPDHKNADQESQSATTSSCKESQSQTGCTDPTGKQQNQRSNVRCTHGLDLHGTYQCI